MNHLKINLKYKFKGIDWIELSEALGLDIGKLSDKTLLKRTRAILKHYAFLHYQSNNEPEITKNIAYLIRKFLRKLAKHKETYYWPIFLGLSKVENDKWGNEVLLNVTGELLEWLWI